MDRRRLTATRACSLIELDAAGGRLCVSSGDREAVVVRAGGEIFAIERACPHEGFPLEQGALTGEVLTCPWHGWRFDLRSGACLGAGEDARSYAVELRDGEVWVELDVEASEAERARAADDLVLAVEAGDAARAVRRLARLLRYGATVETAAALLARYGATHEPALGLATASAADALALARRRPESATRLLAEAAANVAESSGRAMLRLPVEPRPPLAYGGDPGAADALAERCELHDADGAEAIVAGLLERRGADDAARVLAGVCCARFRGPLPLPLVERAALLAGFDDGAGRAALRAAARAVALAPGLEHAAPYADRRRQPEGDVALLARDVGESLWLFDLMLERDERSDASLLAVACALLHVHAARWCGEPRALLHASWLVEDARAWRGGDPGAPPAGDLVASAAGGSGASPLGSAIRLAATRAALELGEPAAVAGVSRLLHTPSRERFTARELRPARQRTPPGAHGP